VIGESIYAVPLNVNANWTSPPTHTWQEHTHRIVTWQLTDFRQKKTWSFVACD